MLLWWGVAHKNKTKKYLKVSHVKRLYCRATWSKTSGVREAITVAVVYISGMECQHSLTFTSLAHSSTVMTLTVCGKCMSKHGSSYDDDDDDYEKYGRSLSNMVMTNERKAFWPMAAAITTTIVMDSPRNRWLDPEKRLKSRGILGTLLL